MDDGWHIPDYVTGYSYEMTGIEDYGAELCDICGAFYWRDEGHECPLSPQSNKTYYLEVIW